MTKKSKSVSSSSTNAGKAAASTLASAPDVAPDVPETPPSDTTVAMRITRPSSDYVPAQDLPESQRAPVMLHDLKGYVIFALHPQLKEVLGEESFERCVSDFEAHEVTAIHREVDSIVYIRMQCVAHLYETPKQAKSAQAVKPD